MHDNHVDESNPDDESESGGLKTVLAWIGFVVLGLLVAWAAWTWVDVVPCGEPEQCLWMKGGQQQVEAAAAESAGEEVAETSLTAASPEQQHPMVLRVTRMKEMPAIRPEQEGDWAALEAATAELARLQQITRGQIEAHGGFSFDQHNRIFERRARAFANFAAASDAVVAVLDERQKSVMFTFGDFK